MKAIRITYHTKPDELGRRQFTCQWEEPDGTFRAQLSKDGQPVGYRRGQVFFTDPAEFIARWRANHGEVEVTEVEELNR